MTRRLTALAAAAILVAACSPTAPAAAPEIIVSDGWARATAPGQSSGAAYLTIANDSESPDRLASLTSDRGSAMIHANQTDNGVVRMRMLSAIDIPARGRVALAPGGTHVMIAPLAAPLVAGETLMLDLKFDRSGVRRVPVTIVAAGAR